MTDLININNSNDPSFRYKIHKINISLTGKGNGCFTHLDNIKIIAKEINHNPLTITKYIGYVLGAKINEDKLWIQGHHKIDNIQKAIFDFIKTFVLCQKCSVPELQYDISQIKKHILIKTHCLGCGHDDCIDSNILNKSNKKIFDKIIIDIQNNLFNNKSNTSKLEDNNDFILDTNQDFF